MNKKMFAAIAIAIVVVTVMTLVGAYFLFLNPCEHQWIDATCTTPAVCVLCGETAGKPIGHHWTEASCVTPKTCSDCALTNGDPLGHKWLDADCVTPKTCDICGLSKGKALGHEWVDATCITPKTCDICGHFEGEALGHDWVDVTYEEPKTCSRCGETEGDPLTRPVANSGGYEGGSGNESTPGKNCVICGRSVSRSDTIYCSTHDCGIGGCSNPAKNANGALGSFCVYHSCQHYDCTSMPIGGTSYCASHRDE